MQRIARNARLPLILAALHCSALQAASRSTSADPATNETAFTHPQTPALAQAEIGMPTHNVAFLAQAGLSLSTDITQTGKPLEAFMLQSGFALDSSIEQPGSHNLGLIVQSGSYNQARIEQHGAYNNALIEQTGTGHSSSVTQHGQGLSVLVRQYR